MFIWLHKKSYGDHQKMYVNVGRSSLKYKGGNGMGE
jgi:hypothetical protein